MAGLVDVSADSYLSTSSQARIPNNFSGYLARYDEQMMAERLVAREEPTR